MVPRSVGSVPGVSKVSHSILDQSLINWNDVLLSANLTHIFTSCINARLVFQIDRERKPSLSNFRIRFSGEVQVCVDKFHSVNGDLVLSAEELVCEDYFELHVFCLFVVFDV